MSCIYGNPGKIAFFCNRQNYAAIDFLWCYFYYNKLEEFYVLYTYLYVTNMKNKIESRNKKFTMNVLFKERTFITFLQNIYAKFDPIFHLAIIKIFFYY